MKIYIKHLIVIALCVLMMFPFVFTMMGATHDSGWAFQIPFQFGLGTSFFSNIENISTGQNIMRVLFMSFTTSMLTAIISLTLLTLASYAVAKYDFFGKKAIIYLMFIFMTIPQPAYLIGQLQIINDLGMYSTFIGLVIPFVVNLRIFIYLRSIMGYIHNDHLDAARIDGASELKAMTQIGLPLIADKLYLALFLLFIAAWNNFLIPMLIINSRSLFTLPILVSALADPMRYDVSIVFMGLFISILPIVILFLFIQKRVFQSIE